MNTTIWEESKLIRTAFDAMENAIDIFYMIVAEGEDGDLADEVQTIMEDQIYMPEVIEKIRALIEK